jgi:hypothetical protein
MNKEVRFWTKGGGKERQGGQKEEERRDEEKEEAKVIYVKNGKGKCV